MNLKLWFVDVLHYNMKLGETVCSDAHKYVACKRKFVTTSVFHKKYSLHNYCVCTVGVILGAFAKLQKVSMSFAMSVCMEQLSSHWMDFCDLIVEYCLEICRENSSFITILQA